MQDYRVDGDGVNIAARLPTVADAGSICISEAVYQQVYTKVDLAFEDLGVRELKNIEHPIRIWWLVIGGIVVTAVVSRSCVHWASRSRGIRADPAGPPTD